MVSDKAGDVTSLVREVASQRGVALSPAATALLVSPAIERLESDEAALRSAGAPDKVEAAHADTMKLMVGSLERVFDTVLEVEPNAKLGAEVDSRVVLKAIHIRWCNIPPICGR